MSTTRDVRESEPVTAPERIRVMLAVEDSATAEWLRDTLTEHALVDLVGEVQDGLEAVRMARELSPLICVIEAELPVVDGYQTCGLINLVAPQVAPILIHREAGIVDQGQAMRLGARACLNAFRDGVELRDVVSGIAAVAGWRNSREYLQVTDPALMPVVTAISAGKGGVGKTTIAVNLAVTLAQRFPGETVLLDYYSQLGDAGVMLGLSPRRDILDLAAEDLDNLEVLVPEHLMTHRSGLRVLPGGTAPSWTVDPLMSVPFARRLLSVLRRQFRFVVVDLPPVLNPAALHIISRANHFLLVCNFMELTTLRDTMLVVNRIKGEYIGRERLKLLGNRVVPKNRYLAGDLEQATGCRIAHQIPDASEITLNAINSGVPFVLQEPRSKLSAAITGLADLLDPRPEVQAAVQLHQAKTSRPAPRLAESAPGRAAALEPVPQRR